MATGNAGMGNRLAMKKEIEIRSVESDQNGLRNTANPADAGDPPTQYSLRKWTHYELKTASL